MTGKLKLLAVTLPLAGLLMAIAAVIVNDEMKQVQVQMEHGTNLASYSRAMKRPVATSPSRKQVGVEVSVSSSETSPPPSLAPSSSQPQPSETPPSSTETEAETNASIAASLAESFYKQGDEVHVIGGGN